MILFDINNFASITYSSTVSTVLEDEKKLFKKTGIVDIPKEKMNLVTKGFLNYCLGEIANISKKFKSNYGELIITSDFRKDLYWRKQIHPEYKISRDSKKTNQFDEEIWKHFKYHKDLLLEFLEKFNIKLVTNITTKYNNKEVSLEADDIIAVLSTNIEGKHLIISNDSDYHQLLLNHNIKIFNPIHKKLVDKNKKEINIKIISDLLKGQTKDDIYPVTYKSHLDKDFITWMKKEKDIEIKDTPENVKLFQTKFKEYTDEYEKINYDKQTKEIEEGKRKVRRNKSAFSNPGIGEKKVLTIIEKYPNIKDYLEQNIIYKENFMLNVRLYMLDKTTLPVEIREAVLNKFNNIETENNFMQQSQLRQLILENGLDEYKLSEIKSFLN